MTRELFDSFWRAAAYCLHPKVIALSLAPLVIVGGAAAALGYFYWEPALAGVRASLDESALLEPLFAWLRSIGAGGWASVLVPLVLVAVAVPIFVVATLLVAALLMTPAIVRLVAARRFPQLEARRGGSFWSGVAVSLGCTAVALVALVLSIPFWFVPPLVLVLPPLIWGWLATASSPTTSSRRTRAAMSACACSMKSAGPCSAWGSPAARWARRRRCCGR